MIGLLLMVPTLALAATPGQDGEWVVVEGFGEQVKRRGQMLTWDGVIGARAESAPRE